MYRNKKIFGLIPARSSSKGLRHKNIKELCGKPLIVWTIEEALKSRYLDRVIVSTDDREIAKISLAHGAYVPFIRPKSLSKDDTEMVNVVLHAVDFLKKEGEIYDLVVLLQPTSPLRKVEDIDNCIKLLFKNRAKAIVSICKTECHPYKMYSLSPSGIMKNIVAFKTRKRNRQLLPIFYRENGAIYIAHINYLEQKKSFFGKETSGYIMPQNRSVDIDSEIDLKLAEVLINNFMNEKETKSFIYNS